MKHNPEFRGEGRGSISGSGAIKTEELPIDKVRAIVHRSLRFGRIEDIRPIVGEGVANSRLFKFQLNHRLGRNRNLVVKIGDKVGQKEHQGRRLLSPYFDLPKTCGKAQEDAFVYHYVPGKSLNEIVHSGRSDANAHLAHFAQTNANLWAETCERVAAGELVGYPQKLEDTRAIVMGYHLCNRPLRDLDRLPIVVNGKQLPSLRECLAEVSRLVAHGTHVSTMQHGDEGAANDIIRASDQAHISIDNGSAGRRLLAEGVAKLIMWWSVTATSSSFEFVDCPQLKFSYQLSMPEDILVSVQKMTDEILGRFDGSLDFRQLAACVAVYCLRELQWVMKRGNELNPATLLAMAFDAMTGMFSGELVLPGLNQ